MGGGASLPGGGSRPGAGVRTSYEAVAPATEAYDAFLATPGGRADVIRSGRPATGPYDAVLATPGGRADVIRSGRPSDRTDMTAGSGVDPGRAPGRHTKRSSRRPDRMTHSPDPGEAPGLRAEPRALSRRRRAGGGCWPRRGPPLGEHLAVDVGEALEIEAALAGGVRAEPVEQVVVGAVVGEPVERRARPCAAPARPRTTPAPCRRRWCTAGVRSRRAKRPTSSVRRRSPRASGRAPRGRRRAGAGRATASRKPRTSSFVGVVLRSELPAMALFSRNQEFDLLCGIRVTTAPQPRPTCQRHGACWRVRRPGTASERAPSRG